MYGLCAGLHRLDPQRLGDLPERVQALIDSVPEGSAKTNRRFDAALKEVRQELTKPTYDLLRRAEAVGEVQVAVELMRQTLRFDPDHKAIRKALGQVKLPEKIAAQRPQITQGQGPLAPIVSFEPDRQWVSRFEAKMLDSGLVWNPDRGWMPIKHAARYADGEIFDFSRREWTTVAEANTFHARAGRDWDIRTEHLHIRGTADLESLAQIATRLEAMYDEIFSVYAPFFKDGGRRDALQLALGLAEHPPLEIWVYRDHDEYLQRSGAVGWSGGIFRPSNGTAYFYGGPSTTMYHEFTHQVLHVMTGKNRSPSWLTESIAEYTETAQLTSQGMAFPGKRYVGELQLEQLFALREGAAWSRHAQSNRPSAYAEAGSLASFCMDADDSKHRADFIDFIRDSYHGKTHGKQLWEYLGLSFRELATNYAKWGSS